MRIDKNGGRYNYEIVYNKKDDKFGINSMEKNVSLAVGEFNFHRNLGRLYDDLYKFS